VLLYRVICFPNGGEIFQQDNAPCHQSRSTMAFLEEHNINTMPWPPYSPDLNIIENLWGVMKRKIHRKPYTGQETLIEAVQELWSSQEIQDMTIRLCDSMPTRIAACINSRGGYTSY
jgi:transposase